MEMASHCAPTRPLYTFIAYRAVVDLTSISMCATCGGHVDDAPSSSFTVFLYFCLCSIPHQWRSCLNQPKGSCEMDVKHGLPLLAWHLVYYTIPCVACKQQDNHKPACTTTAIQSGCIHACCAGLHAGWCTAQTCQVAVLLSIKVAVVTDIPALLTSTCSAPHLSMVALMIF